MRPIIDLSGRWRFQLDPDDRGAGEQWFNKELPAQINLPGSLQAQGYGDEITADTPWVGDNYYYPIWVTEERFAPYRQPGNIKVPFWLQPEKHYLGPAWYQRTVEIPDDWQGRRITLTLERPHWETRAWLDGIALTSDRQDCALSLSTPHEYDLGTQVSAGAHRLTIRVDNRMLIKVGRNAHSVSDHTQTAWNGIAGRLELAAGSPVWIADVQAYPDLKHRSVHIKIALGNMLGTSGTGRLTLQASLYNTEDAHTPAVQIVPVDFGPAGAQVEVEYPLGPEARLWDEFHPALYKLLITLAAEANGQDYSDQGAVRFGLRQVSVSGTQIAINGRKIFLRGTLECCIFPLTGYPPTEVDDWKRIIRICQAHGLNHIRFHSYCPPEAAFIAADELGFYYQVECASWANQDSSLGEDPILDAWLYAEGERITRAYGNHPSFLLMAYGNEPAGKIVDFLTNWVKYWKQRDPRRLHTSAAGWPVIPDNDYHNTPEPRIQGWMAGLASRINSLPPETCTDYRDIVAKFDAPVVSHEIGQWCVYPNLDEIPKYNGYLKAKNFEIFRDLLAAQHMGDQAQDFLIASGKQQVLCYKEEIESALRTQGFGGFQLLDLHDFPGQGTALVGILDAFWDEKGYIRPEEFRRFCNETVPLARMRKRCWRMSETFEADIDLAHFGPVPLVKTAARWRLVDDRERTIVTGSLPPATIETGIVQRLGKVCVPLSAFAPARKYRLVAGLPGTAIENDWDLWVFADALDVSAPPGVLVTEALDEFALNRLASGGKVLFLPPTNKVRVTSQIGFSSIFWNTAWTGNQPPHTLGLLCDPRHPVFADFPTEFHGNWQWWELIHGAAAMNLEGMPPDLRPLIQVIDTWFENRRLGLLFEARANGGHLMVCSMDLRNSLPSRLEARQFRHSLLRYLGSDQFNPQIEIKLPALQSLLSSE